MIDELRSLGATLADHVWLVALITVASIAISIAVSIAVIVRLPDDYFAPDRVVTRRRGAGAVVAAIGKNLLGVVVILLGVVMSLPGVPGQGILTILLGVMLCDLPGKRRLEAAIVRRPAVRRALDRIRARRGRPPFRIDARDDGGGP